MNQSKCHVISCNTKKFTMLSFCIYNEINFIESNHFFLMPRTESFLQECKLVRRQVDWHRSTSESVAACIYASSSDLLTAYHPKSKHFHTGITQLSPKKGPLINERLQNIFLLERNKSALWSRLANHQIDNRGKYTNATVLSKAFTVKCSR